jgi:hypothetical protein
VNDPDVPTVKVLVLALVIVGAWLTVKLLLVAPVSEPSVADNVNDPPLVGTRFENVATPPDAGTVNVDPALKAPPALIPIVTLELLVVTKLPFASCSWTVTAGLIALPVVVVVGC